MPKLNDAAILFFGENKKQLSISDAVDCLDNPATGIVGFEPIAELIDAKINEKLASKNLVLSLSQNYSINESFFRLEDNLWLEILIKPEPFSCFNAQELRELIVFYFESGVNPFNIEYGCFRASNFIKEVSSLSSANRFKSEDCKNWFCARVDISIDEKLLDFLKENGVPISEENSYDEANLSAGLELVDFLRILAGYSVLFEAKMKSFKQKLQIAKLLIDSGFDPSNKDWTALIDHSYKLETSLNGNRLSRKVAVDIAKSAISLAELSKN